MERDGESDGRKEKERKRERERQTERKRERGGGRRGERERERAGQEVPSKETRPLSSPPQTKRKRLFYSSAPARFAPAFRYARHRHNSRSQGDGANERETRRRTRRKSLSLFFFLFLLAMVEEFRCHRPRGSPPRFSPLPLLRRNRLFSPRERSQRRRVSSGVDACLAWPEGSEPEEARGGRFLLFFFFFDDDRFRWSTQKARRPCGCSSGLSLSNLSIFPRPNLTPFCTVDLKYLSRGGVTSADRRKTSSSPVC